MDFEEMRNWTGAGGEFSGAFNVKLDKDGKLNFQLIKAVRHLPDKVITYKGKYETPTDKSK